MTSIPTHDRWGPFASGLDPCERRARLRSLRAIARLHLGQRGTILIDALRAAETDDGRLSDALTVLDRLASVDRRRVLASYAAFTRPPAAD